MTIECYTVECSKHSIHGGDEGPFCYEDDCIQNIGALNKIDNVMGVLVQDIKKVIRDSMAPIAASNTGSDSHNVTITFDSDSCFVLGDYRMDAILGVIKSSVDHQLFSSYMVAVSGALRWPISMRPEVLIDARGVLL
jgi:hypothetical protein